MSSDELAHIRRPYQKYFLTEEEAGTDPLALFDRWLKEALASGTVDPNAMTLSTADAGGRVSSRIVLLKEVRGNDFIFYTNYGGRKARQIAANPQAALLFFWPSVERQVHIEGPVQKVSREESEAYFRIRPFESQIGAMASHQSETLAGRIDLEREYARLENLHRGRDVPLPENWGGYAVRATRMEFWQGRPSRLHDRILFENETGAAGGPGWKRSRLSP